MKHEYVQKMCYFDTQICHVFTHNEQPRGNCVWLIYSSLIIMLTGRFQELFHVAYVQSVVEQKKRKFETNQGDSQVESLVLSF